MAVCVAKPHASPKLFIIHSVLCSLLSVPFFTMVCTRNASRPVTAPMKRVSPYLAMVMPVYLPVTPHRTPPPHRSAAQGSSTNASRSDIRLIQYLDSSAHGLVRRWLLIGCFPIHLNPPIAPRPPVRALVARMEERRRSTDALEIINRRPHCVRRWGEHAPIEVAPRGVVVVLAAVNVVL
jgi:hypothetical protein